MGKPSKGTSKDRRLKENGGGTRQRGSGATRKAQPVKAPSRGGSRRSKR